MDSQPAGAPAVIRPRATSDSASPLRVRYRLFTETRKATEDGAGRQ